MNTNLALDGGFMTLKSELKPYTWIDEETITMVGNLLRTQMLSGFLGQKGPQFLGGYWVQQLEGEVCRFGSHKFAVSFNSWTSGLEAIFLALDLPIESEVIVPSWTMSATISAIVNAGLTPVFADIDVQTFTISVNDVLSKICNRTSAICAVELFGKPADHLMLRNLANKNNLVLVSDSAQCPGARVNGTAPSKIADIGGYSLNRHKHIQSGEGGLVVTDNEIYANRLRALRNHGEIAASETKLGNRPIYGHNWRLGEVEALIAYRQYLHIDKFLEDRRSYAREFIKLLNGIKGLVVPEFEVEHDYYILGMRLQPGWNRNFIESALVAEGVSTLVTRYSGLEKLPAFLPFFERELNNAMILNEEQFIGLYLSGHTFTKKNIEEIVTAFKIVFADSRAQFWQS